VGKGDKMEATSVRPEGQRSAQYSHIYEGKFKDRNREVSTVSSVLYSTIVFFVVIVVDIYHLQNSPLKLHIRPEY
jgi:hypothetical protein